MPTLDLLPRHLPGAEVWAYGSRVNDGGHETSDLDIVVRNPSDLEGRNEHLSDLKEALQVSEIPISVDVHDWATLPEHSTGK